MLCGHTTQVHTGNRTVSAVFVNVRVRTRPPPSLGFPSALRLHFLLLNSFFPTAPQRKWSVAVWGPPVCSERSSQLLSTYSNIQDLVLFYLFIYLNEDSIANAAIACNVCYSVWFYCMGSAVLTSIHFCNYIAINDLIKAFINQLIVANLIHICIKPTVILKKRKTLQ